MHPLDQTGHAIDDEALFAACADAAEFYRGQLLGHAGAKPLEYLASRGFDSVVEHPTWGVGYAPPGWHDLCDHLASLGYSTAVIDAAGLSTQTRDGRTIDTFRDRITFTMRDHARRAVGFIGRRAPNAATSAPKYLNTRTTAIYDKSATLYFPAEHRGQGIQNLVVVEGPLDAIAVDLATDVTTIAAATCGTAFTSMHAESVAAESPLAITLAFDSDAAGGEAMLRSYQQLKNVCPLRASRLPVGADPAQLLATQGPQGLRSMIAASRPAADEIVDHHLRTWPKSQVGAEAAICQLREVLTDVRTMPSGEIARQVARLSRLLPFDSETITRELTSDLGARRSPPPLRARPLSPVRRTLDYGPPAIGR